MLEEGITVRVDLRDLLPQIREDARAHSRRTRPGLRPVGPT